MNLTTLRQEIAAAERKAAATGDWSEHTRLNAQLLAATHQAADVNGYVPADQPAVNGGER